MRIIAGEKRGMKLFSPKGDATRPTTDKVREALFGSLQFEVRGACVLDLFAGSGAFGLEAISRGAQCAVLVDISEEAVVVIKKNIQKTGFSGDSVQVLRGEYKKVIKRFQNAHKFDIVFIDPPYAGGYYEQALRMLVDLEIVREGAVIVTESDSTLDFNIPRLRVDKQKRYGTTVLTYYRFEGYA